MNAKPDRRCTHLLVYFRDILTYELSSCTHKDKFSSKYCHEIFWYFRELHSS